MAEHQTGTSGTGVEASSFAVKPASPARRTEDELHICPECTSQLVFPIDWAPAENRRWSVELRCPDCEWQGSGVYAQAIVDRFDEELDRGTESLVEDLKLLARANMEEEIERFATALASDQILPEDF
jgi:predicted RNA-binding Zn-ribbon protein involved in translation (DUF1610 family)